LKDYEINKTAKYESCSMHKLNNEYTQNFRSVLFWDFM
jgi:hypothetical protein